MKIVKLTSENVKRISAVQITPDVNGALITVGGKNGAGKSSVLDSIAYALGGEKLAPSDPIRSGESEAKITIDLSDYVVTRRFYRDRYHEDNCASAATTGGQGLEHIPCDCGNPWGPTKSSLVVANQAGAKYPSPQALLDKLYGKLTFDPLAFSREKDDKQNEILRRLTNLDFRLLDADRMVAFEKRAMARKTVNAIDVRMSTMPFHAHVPAEIIALETVTNELKRARELERVANEASSALARAKSSLDESERAAKRALEHVRDMEKKYREAEGFLEDANNRVEREDNNVKAAAIVYEDICSAVPDFAAIEAKLTAVQADNKRIEENRAYELHKQQLADAQRDLDAEDAKVKEIDARKEATLQAAQFPVHGLGLTETGVTFEGLPFSQVSSSVQLRVSVAIGLALNPTLKVLLIRNGNLLDDESVKQVAEQAAAAGAQVWMEYVTSHADGVSVMLEDGHVAE